MISKKLAAIIITLFGFVDLFSQPLMVNINGGMSSPFTSNEIRYFDGASGGSSSMSNFVEISFDYGKAQYFVEPYVGFGYKYQLFSFDDNVREHNPLLSETGNYIDIGIKKTFEIGEAEFRLHSGIGYQWDSYKSEYYEHDIKFYIDNNAVKYQFGFQFLFNFLKNLDASISWQYTIRNEISNSGQKNNIEYKFKAGNDYQTFYIGLSSNILEIF